MIVARNQRHIIYKGDDKFSWEYAKMAFTLHKRSASILQFDTLVWMSSFLPLSSSALGELLIIMDKWRS
jgi:hypothetical protein